MRRIVWAIAGVALSSFVAPACSSAGGHASSHVLDGGSDYTAAAQFDLSTYYRAVCAYESTCHPDRFWFATVEDCAISETWISTQEWQNALQYYSNSFWYENRFNPAAQYDCEAAIAAAAGTCAPYRNERACIDLRLGVRIEGESCGHEFGCAYDYYCTDLDTTYEPPQCGVCVRRVAVGGVCSMIEGPYGYWTDSNCEYGAYCGYPAADGTYTCEQFSSDQMYLEAIPFSLDRTGGSSAVGAACQGNYDCSSALCVHGRCARMPLENEDCLTDGVSHPRVYTALHCAVPLQCVQGTCVRADVMPVGAPCDGTTYWPSDLCAEHDYCGATDVGPVGHSQYEYQCRPFAAQGQNCSSYFYGTKCAPGLFCSSGRCERVSVAGESCGYLSGTCAEELTCVSGTCQPRPGVGAICARNGYAMTSCDAHSYCDVASTQKCAELKRDDAACRRDAECLSGQCYLRQCIGYTYCVPLPQ
jgi:hypothetical protein